MEFVQVISFSSDASAEELIALEADWRAATRGRRTNVVEWFLTSRTDPRRKIAINGFPSHESAMVNSNLPETDALAQQFGAVTDGDFEFFDGDLVDQAAAEREGLIEALVTAFSSGKVLDGVFAENVFVDINVPHWRYQIQGVETLRMMLGTELDPATVEHVSVTPGVGGFVAELAIRNERYFSRQMFNVRTAGGLITEITMFCTGNWDLAQYERQQREAPMLRAD